MIGIALMAVPRKVIVLDFSEGAPEHVYGLAAVAFDLVIGYFLIVSRGGVHRAMPNLNAAQGTP